MHNRRTILANGSCSSSTQSWNYMLQLRLIHYNWHPFALKRPDQVERSLIWFEILGQRSLPSPSLTWLTGDNVAFRSISMYTRIIWKVLYFCIPLSMNKYQLNKINVIKLHYLYMWMRNTTSHLKQSKEGIIIFDALSQSNSLSGYWIWTSTLLFLLCQVCDINSRRRVPDRHPSRRGCVQEATRLSQGDFNDNNEKNRTSLHKFLRL